MAAIELPSRVYPAKTRTVKTLDCVEVDIDLGFQTSVRRRVAIEGVDRMSIPAAIADAAFHCMIILLGGRDLYVQTDDFSAINQAVRARVFVDDPDVPAATPGMLKPMGFPAPLLEVGTFWRHLSENDFRVGVVHDAFNRKGKKARSAERRSPDPVATAAPHKMPKYLNGGDRPRFRPAGEDPPPPTLAERLRDDLRPAGRRSDTVSHR